MSTSDQTACDPGAFFHRDRLVLSTFTGLRHGDDPATIVPMLRDLGLTHFELNTPLEYRAEDLTPQELEQTLQQAHQHGLGVFLTDHNIFTGVRDANPDAIRDYVHKWKKHPAVSGYYVWDEPRLEDFQDVRRTTDLLDELDPDRLSLTALLPSYGPYTHPVQYPNYVRDFVNKTNPKVLSFDYYPARLDEQTHEQVVWTDFFRDLKTFWKVSRETGKPFWYYAACCKWYCSVDPTPAAIGLQVWTAIAFGASGIQYFISRDCTGGELDFIQSPIDLKGQPSQTYKTVQTINQQLQHIWPKLKGYQPTGVSWNVGEDCSGSYGMRLLSEPQQGLVVSEWAKSQEDEVNMFFIVNPSLHDSHTLTLPGELTSRVTTEFTSNACGDTDSIKALTRRPGTSCLMVTHDSHEQQVV